jgi:recombination protein RecA
MSAARAALVEELRRLSVRLEPRQAAVAPTGHEALDQLLSGGLPRGRLTELVGPRSSGRTALSVKAISAATRRGEAVALIDVDGVFDPRRAEAVGVELDRLLWVRAGDGQRALRAADLVLEAGGFGLLVIDFGEQSPRSRETAFLRLQRAAKRAQAACLLVAPHLVASSFAALTLEASVLRPILSGREASPRLLRALECQLHLLRTKLGTPGSCARLRLAWR